MLAKPKTFMNLSGKALGLLVRKFKIKELTRLVVIHDELDLPPGKVKLKTGGGTAGHRGLESVKNSLGSADFLRIRVGIGHPSSRESHKRGEKGEDPADYVLGAITEPETLAGIAEAADIFERLFSGENI